MRQLVHDMLSDPALRRDMLLSPTVWVIVGVPIFILVVVFVLAGLVQRADYQRRMDMSRIEMIDSFEAKLKAHDAAIAKSQADRRGLHKAVDQLKSDVHEVEDRWP